MSPPSPRLVRLALAATLLAGACGLPTLEAERARPRPLPQTSFIYASDGTLLTALHAEQDRVVIGPRRIPRVMKDAVVAVEDQRFWTHGGVDVKAMIRAAAANVREGAIVQGGSTITQQYVKNTITGDERTVDRKMKEALLAFQLEQEMSKEEILAGYLNTVYFGQGAYGIQQAAREFFSKPARKLNLVESATLAGMIASPATYDPVDNPKRAVRRRNDVLKRMYEQGALERDHYLRARTRRLGLRLRPEDAEYPAAHFVEYVKRQILTSPRFGRTYTQRYNFLFGGGLRIRTTIDLEMQAMAEDAIDGILSQPGDPYGALTAVESDTGFIRAMVGGRDFFASPKEGRFAKVNLATGGSTGRQAGSSFKPFALVAALENGISPQQIYQGGTSIALTDSVCRNSPTDPWVVQNYEGSAYGSVTLEAATVASVNVVYAQVIRDVGPRQVVDAARRMGIRSPLRPFCSSVLGSNEVNTLEMASAYGTLANLGTHVAPVAIERIEDADGRVIFEANPRETQAVSPAVAWAATDILKGVIERGTGVAAGIGRPAAGKTGTAQQWRDAWFVGFVPQLTAAVWVGFPQGQISMVPPTTRIRVTGGSFPAQIWRSFMLRATQGLPPRDFQQPPSDLVEVAIDVTQGCVATELTPSENIRIVEFIVGTQPTRKCVVARPEITSVPSVIGMTVSTAYELLEGAGFAVVQRTEYDPSYAPGTVVAQEPAAGSQSETGIEITITVSTDNPPLVDVPEVVGLYEGKAVTVLEEAGFEVQVVEADRPEKGTRPRKVLAQTPEPGRQRPLGSTVTITINPRPAKQ
ncbi:MAG TPA: PBP1A family penicillin-binding protein [Actinomycetota bacterium]